MEDRKYPVDLYLYDRPLIINPIEFYQNDTESCAIEFNFNTDRVNKFDLTNKTVEVRVTKPDLTVITDSATITGPNTAVWELKLGAISVAGSCSISIYVYKNVERLTFGTLKYKVIADREVTNVISQPEYPLLTKLISDVQGALNESNQVNENISVMELERVGNENTRKTAEQQRVTNEDNRAIAEQQRQQAETTRNSEFNNIKSEYSGIKGIMLDTNNAANLQSQVNQVNTQLAEIETQKANVTEVRKDTGIQPISMSELSTEVKTAMTGGSVPVVGINSVLEENIVNRQVKSKKISKFAVNQDHLDKTLFNDYSEIGYVGSLRSLDQVDSYMLFKFPTGETFTVDTTKNYRVKFRLKNFSQYSLTVKIGRASVKANSILDETVLGSPATIQNSQHAKDAIISYNVALTGYILNSTNSVPIVYIAVGNNTIGINYLKHFEICDLIFESEDGLTSYPVERYEIFNNGRHTDDSTFYYLDSLDKRISTKTYVNAKINEVKNELGISTYFSTKKWGFVGDSQTIGWDDTGIPVTTPYPNTVASLLGLSSYVNYGIAGSTIARSTKTPIVDRLTSLATDLDIISVFAGTNDWGHGTTTVQRPIGTIDSTDVTTFYGALNYICDYLITNYPTKLIFLATPLHREGENVPNSLGFKLIDYVNAMRAIGQKYSIPVLDLYNTGNLYPDNPTHKAQLIKDGIHPTQWYYTNVLARKFTSFAKSII